MERILYFTCFEIVLCTYIDHEALLFFRSQAAGIAVMAVGIFARVSASNYSALMDEGGFKSAANILIAAGALVMIIGAIGCCGVMKEKKWLLLLVSHKCSVSNDEKMGTHTFMCLNGL